MSSSKKILVIEDDAAMLQAIQDTLVGEGFDVVVASDGEVGFEMIKTEKPDLVLLDLMLSKLSGVDVLRAVRAEGWGAELPVFVMTNLTYMEGMSEVKEMATEFLLKGDVKLDELVKMIRENLGLVSTD